MANKGGGDPLTLPSHVLARIRYLTKYANPAEISRDFTVAIISDLKQWVRDRNALQGVTRFWGSLSRGRKSQATASASIERLLSAV